MSEDIVLPPGKLAFLDSNNNVMDVLHVEERLSAILQSNPEFLDITELSKTQNIETGDFKNPETGEISRPYPMGMPSDYEE